MLTNHFYPLSKPVIPMICEYKDTEKSKIFVLYLVFYSITPISETYKGAFGNALCHRSFADDKDVFSHYLVPYSLFIFDT